MKKSRRTFIKTTAIGTVGLSAAFSAKSYGAIIGSNDRVNCAVVGLNGRGKAHIKALAAVKNTQITGLCDVDSRVETPSVSMVKELTGEKSKFYSDYRSLLDDKDLDVITIATPDHWHAPMTLIGVQAGKNVFVEKPCCHNPKEGEMLVAAQSKYKPLIQMGNQQRSAPTSIMALQDIKDGVIGDVYYGKAWYSNKRGSIGVGKQVAVPEWLDWELWQGPAPRKPYKDNWVHYNWHWFWNWGTGEINNNGAHEIDICRWALGVDYPNKVTSSGGRYHFTDDWEFYDTQNASFEFEGGKMITWEGRSCNNHQFYERGRGVTIHGTKGTIMMDRNGYFAYDQDGKVIKQADEKTVSATTDTVGMGGLDVLHMNNFIEGIRSGQTLNSPIDEGYKSNLLCHLGNISQHYGRELSTNSKTGRIENDSEAMSLWTRDYETGWEPQV